jgi:hypothetical protein
VGDRKRAAATSHTFIIKIWQEASPEEAGCATWRGHITHVTHSPTPHREYLEDPRDIISFIEPYLEQMGVKPGPLGRVRRWLRSATRYPKR